MHVVMDHREPDLIQGLFDSSDSVSVVQLSLGDYRVDGHLLFERKTVHDLCVSIVDGRLFSQAIRLKKTRYHPVLIIEGRLADYKSCGVSRESVQGALINLTVFLGIPILRSCDPEETVRLMRYTSNQGNQAVKGGLQRFGYAPKRTRNRQLFFLQGFPGVGKKRAALLLDHFGSLEGVILADEDELASVEGIGPSLAGSMKKLLVSMV